jgi:hypothetical protein
VFDDGTRTMPPALDIVNVSVTEDSGEFSFTIENVSDDRGALVTPIGPVFWAVHNDSFAIFTAGETDDGMGLETLAEDGSPADLVSSYMDDTNASAVGAATTPVGGSMGPAAPGESYEFSVTPDMDNPYLTIASMVVNSNDAFLAFPGGLPLLDDTGATRPTEDIERDIRRMLGVWDAGTEINEVPGVGPNQAPRQSGGDTGPADPDNTVRLYSDVTNDLAGESVGGFVQVEVATVGDGLDFEITVTNTSDDTVYPGVLTPVLWATHSDAASFFTAGEAASEGMESLAEDGDASTMLTSLQGLIGSGVGDAGVADNGGGPLTPGDSVTFTLSPDATNRYFSMASMVVPSNDTFVAFPSSGIELLDGSDMRRATVDLEDEIASMLTAWDAGTELNQCGAAGRDQAPRQASPDTGEDEGGAVVRMPPDGVYTYPRMGDVLRVTVTPDS